MQPFRQQRALQNPKRKLPDSAGLLIDEKL
jgi:hypothetical protein